MDDDQKMTNTGGGMSDNKDSGNSGGTENTDGTEEETEDKDMTSS